MMRLGVGGVLIALVVPVVVRAGEPTPLAPRWVVATFAKPRPVAAGVFSPDGKHLVVSTFDGSIQVRNAADGALGLTLAEKRRPADWLAFSPDGSTLIAGESNDAIQLWDWAKRQPSASLDGVKGRPRWHAFSADGKSLFTLSAGSTPHWQRWDLATRKAVEEAAVSGPYNDAALTFDGKSLVAAQSANVISWSIAQRSAVATFRRSKDFVQILKVRLAPDGLSAAVGYADGSITLLDARSWKPLATLPGNRLPVLGLAYAPDGKRLAVADAKGLVTIWNITTLEAPSATVLHGFKAPATFAAFSPDRGLVAVGGVDGSAAVWDVAKLKDVAAPKSSPPPFLVAGKQRLALVGAERGAAVQNALALAEAKLTEASVVHLVERRALDQVLTEQKLTLAGFVHHDQVLKVGKLVGADLFAFIETDKAGQQPVGMVVYHAATGVRLWDVTLAGTTLEDNVAAIDQGVRGALKKLEQFNRALKTVVLASVRNVDLPRGRDVFCETVGILLERGLAASPSLALLERTRLEQVIQERNLPTDAPLGKLLASLLRIELEITRGDDAKTIRATASLHNSQGKLLARPSVVAEADDAAGLARALAAAVAKAIDIAPGSVAQDRVKEARRFAREAEFLMFHGDVAKELRCREAAVALHPDDVNLRWGLGNALRRQHMNLVARAKSADDLRLALDHVLRALDQEAIIQPKVRAKSAELDGPAQKFQLSLPELFTLETRHARLITPEIAALVAEVRRRSEELLDVHFEHAFSKVNDRAGFEQLLRQMYRPGDFAMELFDVLPTAQQKAAFARHLERWLTLAQKHGTPPLSPRLTEDVYGVLSKALALQTSLDGVARYRAALRQTPTPFVRLYEAWLDAKGEMTRPGAPLAARQKAARSYRLLVQQLLASDEGRRSTELRLAGYRTFGILLHHDPEKVNFSYSHPLGREWAELARYMIERKDFYPAVAQDAVIFLARKAARDDERQALDFVKQLLPLLAAPDTTILFETGQPNAFAIEQQRRQARTMLLARRQQIVSRYPDLDAVRVDLWDKVRELIDVHGATTGIVRIARPLVHGDSVYVLALGQTNGAASSRYLQLLKFSLTSNEQARLGKIAVDTGYTPPTLKELQYRSAEPDHGEHRMFITDALLADGQYFAATRDQGIFIFALDEPKVERLDAGLPSLHVQRIAHVAGTLFAGLGAEHKEAYLAAVDLKSRQTKIVASSRRTDKQSPFDDAPPWRVLHLDADAKRRRALFAIDIPSNIGVRGLWEIDARTHDMKQLHEAKGGILWVGPVEDDRVVVGGFSETALVDLVSGKSSDRPFDITTSDRLFHVQAALPNVLALTKGLTPPRALRRGFFVQDGRLWSMMPFARTSLDGRTRELLRSPRAKSDLAFQPWEGFFLLGERVLLADGHGLWIASLKK